MLILNDEVANEWNFIGTFAYSPTEIGVVIRPRTATDGKNDIAYIWNVASDRLKRSEIHSRLWLVQDVIDHGGALKFEDEVIETGKARLIGAMTNRACELPVDKSQFDLVFHSPSGTSSNVYKSFFLPTAEMTSLIYIPHARLEILCLDPECKNGLRWRHDRGTLAAEIVPTGSQLYVVRGASRPSPTCDVLLGHYKSGFAVFASFSTATGAVNRSLRLQMAKEWGDIVCDPAAISKDGRWLALVSRNSESDYSLRIYDLEHEGNFRELPIAQQWLNGWSRFHTVGIRNNDNIVLKSKGGFWEVGIETAQVRQRIFELPRKAASIE